ncbi:hypothetical protein QBC42DRAFT_258027 [Cladorrhinum samala]|uniref:Rhodopsin domain-containing protein n=1 Tax=Cladorrhinum samala TaxID=585594 RepID=A0AAV9I597_9PEZI|nr:hypothetical protein QBC42DRAFT_258027 [Cladorrhinum samala]
MSPQSTPPPPAQSELPPPMPDMTAPGMFVTEQVASVASKYIAVTTCFVVVSLIPFAARMYVRARPAWRFGADDYLIVAGLACAIVDWIMFLPTMYLESGEITLGATRMGIIRSHIGITLWSLTMTLVKTSVVMTLLRLPMTRVSRAVLYSIMGIQIAYCIVAMSYQLFRCRPFHAAWDILALDGKCPSQQVTLAVSSVGSAINIATDIVLSIAPTVIMWNLHRPVRERILICTLSCVGLFASGASITKAVLIGKAPSPEHDLLELGLTIAKWTVVEGLACITAACCPSLKRPIEYVLGKFGIVLIAPAAQISFVHVESGRRGDGKIRRQSISLTGKEEAGDADRGLSYMTVTVEERLGSSADSTVKLTGTRHNRKNDV